MTQYGKVEYWDERYSRDLEPFDWYHRFSGLQEYLEAYLKPESKILNIGCGNSRLSEDMFDEGYTYITNIDISSVVIQQMQEKYRDKDPNFIFTEMDVRYMDFKDDTFDVVIDKGTLDAILCGEDSAENISKMMKEIHRVLAVGGVYILITYGLPEHRKAFMENDKLEWTVLEPIKIDKPIISTSISLSNDEKEAPDCHYIFIARKEKSTPSK